MAKKADIDKLAKANTNNKQRNEYICEQLFRAFVSSALSEDDKGMRDIAEQYRRNAEFGEKYYPIGADGQLIVAFDLDLKPKEEEPDEED